MKKVQVRDRCFCCNGQSYIFERERWCLLGDGDQKYKTYLCCWAALPINQRSKTET